MFYPGLNSCEGLGERTTQNGPHSSISIAFNCSMNSGVCGTIVQAWHKHGGLWDAVRICGAWHDTALQSFPASTSRSSSVHAQLLMNKRSRTWHSVRAMGLYKPKTIRGGSIWPSSAQPCATIITIPTPQPTYTNISFAIAWHLWQTRLGSLGLLLRNTTRLSIIHMDNNKINAWKHILYHPRAIF